MFLYLYFVELKNRFFLLVLSWICTVITCYFYKEILLFVIINSTSNLFLYNNIELYFICTDVKELFYVYLNLTLFVSNQLCAIIMFYHLFMFFYLGLYWMEYIKTKKILKTVLIFFFFTIVVSYIFVIPLSWYFFLGFQHNANSINIISLFFEAKISEYFDFISQIYYICFLSFQIIGFSFFILNSIFVEINILEIKYVRKMFYFIFVIFSTIITPPDLFSQILMSFFFILVYELFIFIKILNFYK